MSHAISAIVCEPSGEIERMSAFDLPVIAAGDFVIIPLDHRHAEEWTDRLGLSLGGGRSDIIVDCGFVHHVAAIAAERDYALVETEYFGGIGEQMAAVFRKGEEKPIFVSERRASGPINQALLMIGVVAQPGMDEFDSIGLGRYRNFDDFFEKYYGDGKR